MKKKWSVNWEGDSVVVVVVAEQKGRLCCRLLFKVILMLLLFRAALLSLLLLFKVILLLLLLFRVLWKNLLGKMVREISLQILHHTKSAYTHHTVEWQRRRNTGNIHFLVESKHMYVCTHACGEKRLFQWKSAAEKKAKRMSEPKWKGGSHFGFLQKFSIKDFSNIVSKLLSNY